MGEKISVMLTVCLDDVHKMRHGISGLDARNKLLFKLGLTIQVPEILPQTNSNCSEECNIISDGMWL